MIVKLDQTKRPPWKPGDKDAPVWYIDRDWPDDYDPPLEEPWKSIYEGRDWTEYYDFEENELYLVLEISASYFRILGKESLMAAAYFYSKNYFEIVDETFPDNWELFSIGNLPEQNIRSSAKALKIYNYSDLRKLEDALSVSISTYPAELGIYGFGDYCEGQSEAKKVVGAYLENIRKEQNALNGK